jgi:two-component system, chemotaxis family, CheB/CheR fusion protein
MPADSGMAFVVVTHLDPKHQSWLADIIARRTSMPVSPVQDGEGWSRAGSMCCRRAQSSRCQRGACICASAAPDRASERPSTSSSNSIAEDCGENAIGIVLSGGGSDGPLGIKAIKESGGLTLAQGSNRSEPRFKDMPESARATGLVDLVVPVEDMPRQVEDMPRHLLNMLQSDTWVESERIAAARNTIYGILQTRVGHDFSEYKDKTFARRLQRRMQVLQLTDIDAYIERLHTDGAEAPRLFHNLLIGVTAFFRDAAPFLALESTIIPQIFEARAPKNNCACGFPAAPPAKRSTRSRSCCASTSRGGCRRRRRCKSSAPTSTRGPCRLLGLPNIPEIS